MEFVTIEDLTTALDNTFGREGMPYADVKNLADYIMNFFGFDDSIPDSMLSPKDRTLFYMLEDLGILKTARDEVKKDKKPWRFYYWEFNKQIIKNLLKESEKGRKIHKSTHSIYSRVSEEDWAQHDYNMALPA